MPDYIPTQDNQFDAWAANYAAYAAANQAALGLTVAEVADLTTAQTNWATAWAAHNAAQLTAKGATQTKDETRDALEAIVRGLTKGIQGRPTVTDDMRQQLGVTVPDRTPTPLSPDIVILTQPPLIELDFSQRSVAVVHFGLNPTNESLNAKPEGIRGARIQYALGGIPAEPSGWAFLADDTNSPYIHQLGDTAPTKIAYRAQWFDRLMRLGPFGDPAEATFTS